MAQFDVYPNQRASHARVPYLLDVQSDLLSLGMRVVVPLVSADHFGPPISRLNPCFVIEHQAVVMSPTDIGGVPARQLGPVTTSLAHKRDEIIAALDFLIQGF